MQKGIKNYDKAILFRELAMILDSDISLYEGFQMMSKRAGTKKDSLAKMADGALAGMKLSEVLRDADLGVEAHELKLIELGENTGKLPRQLRTVADNLELRIDLDNRLSQAFRYPAILTVCSILLIVALMVSVVPVFESMLLEAGAEIGAFSSSIFALSAFLKSNILVVGTVIAAISFAIFLFLRRTSAGRMFRDDFWINSVFTKKISRVSAALSFVQNLALLIESGSALEAAFETIKDTQKSTLIKADMDKSIKKLKDGGDLSDSMEELSIFPEMLIETASIAYKTGHLVDSLNRAEAVLRRDLDNNIDAFIGKIEPTLIVVLSLVIAAVLLAGVVPIFQILDFAL